MLFRSVPMLPFPPLIGYLLIFSSVSLRTSRSTPFIRRIFESCISIEHNGSGGIGKPERLTGESSSYWNRRIDDCNRIVCQVDGNIVRIVQCGSRYRDAQNGNSLIRDSIHGDLARPQRHLRTAPHRSSRYRGREGRQRTTLTVRYSDRKSVV